MSKKRKRKMSGQQEKRSNVGFLLSQDAYDTLCVSGYTKLSSNPEIMAGCLRIAEVLSSMTIYLMANTDKGDERVKNELSRKVDIDPNQYMTKKTWMTTIVMNLLLHGDGNSVVFPMTENGLLGDMFPIAPSRVGFRPDGWGYKILIDGAEHDPDNYLHFVLNPDPDYPWKGMGLRPALKDVANNLKQAAATEKAFMGSKYKPSVIVKVDGLIDEFSNKTGREKLMKEYLETNEVGQPWIIPANDFSVEQVRPLSLSDLAIKDTVELDKKTVASILGIPPFLLGVGTYNAAEWNGFISNTIRPLAEGIQQELTKKLILSPNWYWKFNVSSLYSYDLKTIAQVFGDMYVRGIVDGNEVRDKLSMSPREGLDELIILENYIPLGKIGDQLKLNQEE